MTETAVESPAEAIAVTSAEPVVADTPPAAEKKANGTAKASSSKTTVTKSSPLRSLAATPSALDDVIRHIHRCIRTRGGTDCVLLFTTYASRLVGALLKILGQTTLNHSSSVVLPTAAAPQLATLALQFSKRIQGFTDMLGEWRTMNRLWGIFATYLAARDLILRLRGKKLDESGEKVAPPSRLSTLIELTQYTLLIGYHFGEASWLLTSKCATSLSQKTANKLGLWAARSWSAWVFLELLRLLAERARRTPAGDVAAEEEWKTNWKADFVGTLPWMPLSMHWGSETGLLPEIAVAAIATWPATVNFKNLWRQTA